MAERKQVTPEFLATILRYDQLTGILTWRARPLEMFSHEGRGGQKKNHSRWNTVFAGEIAFSYMNVCGYWVGKIFGQQYSAHRVIWALVNKEWPEDQIDHINGDRSDNRYVNLRAVSRLENSQNQKIASDNSSGLLGVGLCSNKTKWFARIGIDKTSIHLGTFDNIFDAACARKSAENKYGYHPNHGRR